MSVGDDVEQLPELNTMAWPFLFIQQDWDYTRLLSTPLCAPGVTRWDSFTTAWKP